MANYAVRLESRNLGIVAFDVASASSNANAKTQAVTDAGASSSNAEGLVATGAAELLSDNQPDLYGRVSSTPAS